MALKAVLTPEQFSDLDDATKALYGAETKGVHVLAVEPASGWALEDVKGLKATISAERARASEAAKALKAYESEDGERLDPEASRAAIAKLAELGSAKPSEQHKAQIDSINAEWTKKYTKLQTESEARLKALEGENSGYLVDNEASRAFGEHKVNPKLFLPHVQKHVRAIAGQDGKRVARVFDADGNERLSTTAGSTAPMTVAELVAELVREFPDAVQGSGLTGAGTTTQAGAGGTATAAGKTIRVQAGSPHATYLQARAEAEKTGAQIQFVEA